jgi:hypothetical protein
MSLPSEMIGTHGKERYSQTGAHKPVWSRDLALSPSAVFQVMALGVALPVS